MTHHLDFETERFSSSCKTTDLSWKKGWTRKAFGGRSRFESRYVRLIDEDYRGAAPRRRERTIPIE